MFQAVALVLFSLAGFTISIMGMTFIYVWLYNQTGSLFLMIVFHALSNTFNAWFSTLLVAPQAATFFIALMPWVVVTLLQWRFGKNFMLRGPAGKPADM